MMKAGIFDAVLLIYKECTKCGFPEHNRSQTAGYSFFANRSKFLSSQHLIFQAFFLGPSSQCLCGCFWCFHGDIYLRFFFDFVPFFHRHTDLHKTVSS